MYLLVIANRCNNWTDDAVDAEAFLVSNAVICIECRSPFYVNKQLPPQPPIGNEIVPKTVLNDTVKMFFLNCNQHFGNFRP